MNNPSRHPPFYILRHGETEWNRQGRLQGHLDSPLTALGREQARRQGESIRQLGLIDLAPTVFVSPLGRARETWNATGVSESFAAPVIDDRLAEVSMGSWQGVFQGELERKFPDPISAFELSVASPDGESYTDLRKRVLSFVSDQSRPLICVTHGMTALLMRGIIKGLSRDEIGRQSFDQGVVYALINGDEKILA